MIVDICLYFQVYFAIKDKEEPLVRKHHQYICRLLSISIFYTEEEMTILAARAGDLDKCAGTGGGRHY